MTIPPPPGKLTPTISPSDNRALMRGRLPPHLSSMMLMDLPSSNNSNRSSSAQHIITPRDLTSIIDQAIAIAESTITRHEDGSVSLSSSRQPASTPSQHETNHNNYSYDSKGGYLQ